MWTSVSPWSPGADGLGLAAPGAELAAEDMGQGLVLAHFSSST